MPEDYFNQNDLAYDLRQRYAKIVGDHLEIVAHCRQDKNYHEYFIALEDLYTITQHKFKEDKKKDSVSYSVLRARVIEVSNKYPNTWSGEFTTSNEIAEIEEALRAMERFLYTKIDEANMFGGKRSIEHLS